MLSIVDPRNLAKNGAKLGIDGVKELADKLKRQNDANTTGVGRGVSKGGGKPDLYVSPNGEALPATGYKYSDSRYAESILKDSSSPGTPNGHYIGFEKLDSAKQAQNRYQVSPEWSDSKVRGEFDTLQLYNQKTQSWDVNVPTTKGNTTKTLEPYTESYPEYGKGGAQQYITHPEKPLKYNNVDTIDD